MKCKFETTEHNTCYQGDCVSEWEHRTRAALNVDLGSGGLTHLRRGKKNYPSGNAFPRRTSPADLEIEARKDYLAAYVLRVYRAAEFDNAGS